LQQKKRRDGQHTEALIYSPMVDHPVGYYPANIFIFAEQK